MKRTAIAMRRFFILFITVISLNAFAQHEISTDSIKKELDEVVVQTAPVIRKTDMDIYTVTNALKERSSTTLNLIGNMNIPGLSVNEMMEKINSSLGTVQIRLNGRKIDVMQLKAINPADIRRIEWIDNPGLKYGTGLGAVLNIIVQNPTVGGSFMLYAQEGLPAFFNNSSANLTLNNGASQWKVGGWAGFRGKLDLFRKYDDRYMLPDGTILQRTQKPTGGQFDQAQINPYVSYNYLKPDTTNFYVGFNFYDNLKQVLKYEGLLESEMKRDVENIRLTEIDKEPYQRTPSLDIYFEQSLPHNQTLVFSSAVSYSEKASGREYHEYDILNETNLVDIDNNIRNYTYAYYLEGNYIKKWNKAGQLTTGLQYNGSDVRSVYLDYDNTKVRQRLDKLYFFTEYMIPVRKITFTIGLKGTWNKSSVKGGQTESSLDFTPRMVINWRASNASRWNATYWNYVTSPGISQLSPVTQAIDGIQVERGNPDLKSYITHRFMFRYNFSNNRNLNITAYLNATHSSNPIMNYYTWEGDKILRSYSNEGAYNRVGGNVSVSYQPLPEWLSLSADITFNHYVSRGKRFRHVLDAWEQNFSIQAYHWNWVLGFDFNNPGEYLFGESITRGERFNILSLSYKWKDWNFSAMIFMAFGKYSQSEKVIAELVQQTTIMKTTKIERFPMISVNYNINWGHQKKTAKRKLNGTTETNTGATAAGR